jgi:hypothetical protein
VSVEVFLVGEEVVPLGDVKTNLPYMTGYPTGDFKPDKEITRAEVAAIFAKILPTREGTPVAFKDVAPNHWAYSAIQASVINKIFSGDDDGNFRPDEAITRGEIAAVITNYWKLIGHTVDGETKEVLDVKEHWAKDMIYKLYQAKLVSGYPDGTYRPDDSTKRAEFTVIMNNLLGRKMKVMDDVKFGDIKGHWAKHHINTATELAD